MPRNTYEQRLAKAKEGSRQADDRHRRLAGFRLLVFLGAAGLGWAVYSGNLSVWALLSAPIIFVVLVWLQSRAAVERRFAGRAIAHYERGLGRLDDRWMGQGETGERFRDAAHPYSDDLDLFGTGGLFELLSTARTRAGERQLAEWLLAPATRSEVLLRHQAIEELRNRLDLREDLAALGEDFRTGVQPTELAEWGVAPRAAFASWAQPTALMLSLLGAALIVAYFALGLASPGVRVALICTGALEALFALPLRGRVATIAAAVESPAHDLDLLSQVLARFEQEQFQSTKLAALRSALDVAGKPASRRIADLQRLVDLLHSRDNLLVRMFGPLVLWTTQVAFAIERWRAVSGSHVGRWVLAVGELEALSALAGYAYEHPADPFPEVMDGSAKIWAGQLGHPLLPDAVCVRNDVDLSSARNFVVISGSNMSGKSTYLRTIGVNAVLALAGAPVRARAMVIGSLRIGASIRVSDSLQGGTSRFYAEITRLKEIVKLSEQGPTLFLLDELLNGTNSHDRGIGAAGVVRGLLDRGAVGIVTTHDLALTSLGEANQHFEDELTNGEITFDYRIRPGVVQKSNALELMRAIGLKV